MNTHSFLTTILTVVLSVGFSQEHRSSKDSPDGIDYKTVIIGTQVWMAENLNVSKFRNGDPIPHAKTNEEWVKAGKNKQPAWCTDENSVDNSNKSGKLYNWYAITDKRGLIPIGWHLPSHTEFKTLSESLIISKSSIMQIVLEFDYPEIIKILVNKNTDSKFLSAIKNAKTREANSSQTFTTLLFEELLKTSSEKECTNYFLSVFNSQVDENSTSLATCKKLLTDSLSSIFDEGIKKIIPTLKHYNVPAEISGINTVKGYVSLVIDSSYKKQWREIFLLKKDLGSTSNILESNSSLNFQKLMNIVEECRVVFKDTIGMNQAFSTTSMAVSRFQEGEYLEHLGWSGYGYVKQNQAYINHDGSQQNKGEYQAPVTFSIAPCRTFMDAVIENQYGIGRYIRCVKD